MYGRYWSWYQCTRIWLKPSPFVESSCWKKHYIWAQSVPSTFEHSDWKWLSFIDYTKVHNLWKWWCYTDADIGLRFFDVDSSVQGRVTVPTDMHSVPITGFIWFEVRVEKDRQTIEKIIQRTMVLGIISKVSEAFILLSHILDIFEEVLVQEIWWKTSFCVLLTGPLVLIF